MNRFFLLIVLLILAYPVYTQTRNLKLVKHPTEHPTNQKRKAVVIGMSDYSGNNRLDNTLNDANDMTDMLTKLGFEVTLLTNNDLQPLRSNLSKWYNSIEGDDMAVFYYAGHGMEINGKNFLIPIGAELYSEADVLTYTLSVNNVLDNMDAKKVNMKLLILDACRNNEFARSWNRGIGDNGLSAISAQGTYIAFATAPNSTAQDGGDLRNGIFTYYLKQEILKPGLSISKLFDEVAKNVYRHTNNKQLPFRNNGLSDDFYFIPLKAGDIPVPDPNNPPPAVNIAELMRQADTYYNKEQYAEAVPIYEQAAHAGNGVAQYKLGNCYYNGFGVKKDYNQAVYWYKKAADQGSDAAQNALGVCYENGYGIPKDMKQALEWYKKAAGQGNIIAQNALDRINKSPTPITEYKQSPTPTPVAETEQKRHPAEPEMVFVQGGTFTMGCTSEQGIDCVDNEKPAHQINLSNFSIGKYPITQGQWRAVMGTTVNQQRDKSGLSNPLYGEGDNYPMYYVSWEDVQEFIRKLNAATGKKYRLPTEAEWEYAARGGNISQRFKYSGSNNLNDVAWYKDNCGNTAHPVGTRQANELGIYDMSGNVFEWCKDRIGSYSNNAQTNPQGPSSGDFFLLRGGGWSADSNSCRVTYRDRMIKVYRSHDVGFRIVFSQ